MKVPTPEVLLALRAPNAGWLAAMICALDEAERLLARSEGSVTTAVLLAAGVLDAGAARTVLDRSGQSLRRALKVIG